MTSLAFPSLSEPQLQRLREKGINPDASLVSWLARITGRPVERVLTLVLDAVEDGPLKPRQAAGELTDRQREIVRLAGHGLTDPEIAVVLGLSPFTAKKHMQRALERLGARSRTDAVLLAIATEQV